MLNITDYIQDVSEFDRQINTSDSRPQKDESAKEHWVTNDAFNQK